MLRSALIAASRSAGCRSVVERTPLMRPIVDRFVAGSAVDDAVRVAHELAADRLISFDHLGEDTLDRAQAEQTVEAYRTVLARLDAEGLGGKAEVSVKLSGLGQALAVDGEKIALENTRRICEAAAAAGTTVTVDMEDHTTTDSTLSIVRALRADFPATGTVLQAYLKRTEADCADFAGPGSRIRLCKGAYDEPASVAYRDKSEVDASYVRCLKVLMAGQGYPMVATHDSRLIEIGERLAGQAGRSRDGYEFQMLYGVRPQVQAQLAARGLRMRVYVPYGTEWYSYFMRRLGERPANMAFFLRALTRRG
ncbi:proline dehydrogenase family protein [Amycolatopsis acidiphila]|uniref:proline dehydrogenase n=1 Tax=Amycolatopsis acidiphila TaxID=715473 RepID=A0A558A4H9_9PSEU|nr:proline dehydrogenase family protein [Amycolatopsis acidiphila]TVT19171.1 proline dehydrogenase [Amycolatopsis acidiphila]UIJ61985.1 proline dehydrogenase family protein [Amycolatopsis acidiphila]GHG56761.1 proline dehydrogenase [Amycolatopsis acidiphila]